MTGPSCGGCGGVAAFTAGEGPDAVHACAVCKLDDGGLGLELGGWAALETAEEAGRHVAAEAEGLNVRCKSAAPPQAREAVKRKPAKCATCGRMIPAGVLAVLVTAGAGSKRMTWTVCLGPCVPYQLEPVQKIDPAEAWRAFRRAVAAAEKPEDVPPVWFERYAPVPW